MPLHPPFSHPCPQPPRVARAAFPKSRRGGSGVIAWGPAPPLPPALLGFPPLDTQPKPPGAWPWCASGTSWNMGGGGKRQTPRGGGWRSSWRAVGRKAGAKRGGGNGPTRPLSRTCVRALTRLVCGAQRMGEGVNGLADVAPEGEAHMQKRPPPAAGWRATRRRRVFRERTSFAPHVGYAKLQVMFTIYKAS